MTGFIVLGMAYGIYMNASGFSFIFTGASSVTFGGVIGSLLPINTEGHQLCHDCYVCRYLHGSVAERKESYIFITWTWNFFSLSPCIRTGLFYDSDHDFDYRLIDIITQKA